MKDDMKQLLTKIQFADEMEKLTASKRIDTELENWISTGKKFIYPEKYDEWDEYIRTFTDKTKYDDNRLVKNVATIDVILNTMNALHNEDIHEVAKRFSSKFYPLVILESSRLILLKFANKGPEFFELTDYRGMTPDEEKLIQEYRNYNDSLTSVYSDNNQLK